MNVASFSVPEVLHAADNDRDLVEKISIRNLSFFYGEGKALKNITLPLRENRVTAFIGPSGCGKSTLLRVLNRMYDLYPNQRAEGEILFDGEDLLSPNLDINLLRARIGMVFQKPTPFPKGCPSPRWMAGLSPPCAAPRCGRKSRTSSVPTA